MATRFGAALMLVGATVFGADHARADEPASTTVAPPSVAAAPAPDIVRLKNGGMLRGTISELVPEQSVTIVTVSGQTRQVPMADVVYAGPATKDPESNAVAPSPEDEEETDADEQDDDEDATGDVRPYVTVSAPKARLKLTSEPIGMTFYRESAAAGPATGGKGMSVLGYDRLCTAPCTIELPAGSENLAVARGDETPSQAFFKVKLPPGRSDVVAKYKDNSSRRTIALGAGAIGFVGGVGLIVFGALGDGSEDAKTVALLGGSVLALGGLAVGVVVYQRDTVTLGIKPRRAALTLPHATTFSVTSRL